MEKTYYLDLPTLVGYLQGKSAMLRTSVLLTKDEPFCEGIVFLLHVNTIHCYILNQAGKVLSEGDGAYKRLSRSTEWQVRIDAEQVIGRELLTWRQQHNLVYDPPLPQIIPRPKRTLDALILHQFAPQQALFLRTVFTLVNGQRTVEQIRERLSLAAPQAVDDALNILYVLGLIE